jgi:heat shock protein HslJ
MRIALPSFLLAAVLAGCSAMPSAAEAPSLEGTSWILQALPGQTLVGEQRATLNFEGGRLSGGDGCNRYSMAFKARDGKIEITGPAAATMMACPPPQMIQAEATVAALHGASRYRVEQGRLLLTDASGKLLASFAPVTQQLVGTRWKANGINNGRAAVVSLVSGTAVTLEFGPDGLLNGSGGCNTLRGRYEQDGQKLRLQALAATRKLCPEPGVMEQEAAFIKALGTVASSRVDGNRLELRAAGGELAAGFARVP